MKPGQFSVRRHAIWWGPLLSLIFMLFVRPDPDQPAIGFTLAVAIWMAVWWVTEAVPLAVTSLLPVVLFPLLGIMNGAAVSSTYFNHVIFLFIGGFIVALAMQRWNLHRRIAITVLNLFGTGVKWLLLGFMISTAFLSMWISNTATAMMMVPIALSVIGEIEQPSENKKVTRTGVAILLGIAYSASIGGVITPVGTPPNLSFIRIFEIMFPEAPDISFTQWMLFALPAALIMLAVVWLLMILLFRLHRQQTSSLNTAHLKQLKRELGRMSIEEKWVLSIFCLMALAWVTMAPIEIGNMKFPGWASLLKSPAYINNGTVAIALSIPLFMIRSKKKDGHSAPLMDWKTASKLPWGIVLLFGGGFALASGFNESGLALWIGSQLKDIANFPLPLMILSIALLMTFLTELTSNTATTEMILPVLAGIAVAIQIHPLLLMLLATLSGSMAFMLPVATPPNAIIFGSGKITVREMARAGILLNLVGALVITLVVYLLAGVIFNFDLNDFPVWAVQGQG